MTNVTHVSDGSSHKTHCIKFLLLLNHCIPQCHFSYMHVFLNTCLMLMLCLLHYLFNKTPVETNKKKSNLAVLMGIVMPVPDGRCSY